MPKLRALEWVTQNRWAIMPEHLRTIAAIANRTHEIDFDAIEARRAKRLDNTERTSIRGTTAIIPITGPVFRYANLFTWISGATSMEETARDFTAALDNPGVRAIVLTIDSPGGEINGTNELADLIFAARGAKPIVAHINQLGCSAAYWIASACDYVVADDTAGVGCIGVVCTAWKSEDDGTIEIVSSQTPNKRYDVETDDGRAVLQDYCDRLADVFIERVARNRGVSTEKVLRDFGAGATLVGKQAVAAGLADELGNLESILATLQEQGTMSQRKVTIPVDVSITAGAASGATVTTKDPKKAALAAAGVAVAEAIAAAAEKEAEDSAPEEDDEDDAKPEDDAVADETKAEGEPDDDDEEDDEDEEPKGPPMMDAKAQLAAVLAENIALKVKQFRADHAKRLGKEPMAAATALYAAALRGEAITADQVARLVAQLSGVPTSKLDPSKAKALISDEGDGGHFARLAALKAEGITQHSPTFQRRYNELRAAQRGA